MDFSFFTDIFDGITVFFDFIYDFITVQLVLIIEATIQYVFKILAKLSMWLSHQALQASYILAQELMASFDFKAQVESGFNSLGQDQRDILHVLRIPECINILASAIGTKVTLSFMPRT